MNREIPRYEDTLSEEEFVSQLAPQSEQMMTPMDQQSEAQPEPMMSQQPPMPQQAAPQMPAQPKQPPMPQQSPMPQQQASPAEFNPFPPPSPNKPIGQAQPPVDINSLLGDYDSLVKPMRKLDKGEISPSSIMNKASQVQDPALKNELISIAKYPQEAIREKKYQEALEQYKELASENKQRIPSSVKYGSTIDKQREEKKDSSSKLNEQDFISVGFKKQEIPLIKEMVKKESSGNPTAVEGLYSSENLFEKYGPNQSKNKVRFQTLDEVKELRKKGPEAVFNYIYGGRMGNNLEDDGYNYRGRGYIQLTGKANYDLYGKKLGIDLVNEPNLAADPEISKKILLQYLKDRRPKKGYGSMQDIEKAVGPASSYTKD
jgi:hypothetical protein